MRVNQRMLEAAAVVLGYEVDADRIRQAFDEVEESFSLPTARKRLKRLEAQFKAAGGRGVDFAEQIDNLRIYVACYDKQASEPKEHVLTVKVKASEDLSREEVVALVQRLIECGQEDANASLETDSDDADTEDAGEIECVVE